MKHLFLAILFVFTLGFESVGQYHFTTSFNVRDNKTIVVEITTTGVIINNAGSAPYNCANGFNYDVAFDYSVKCFKNGNEVDFGNIWTLQGYFVCDTQSSFFPLPNSLGSGSTRTTGNQWKGSTNCNTVTVEELICNSIKFEIQMQGYNSDNMKTVTVQGGSNLPIELINFEATKQDRQVELSWSTASELNNDYFTIERSADGISWENVQTILGAGNSSRTIDYSWIDNSPYAGISYYRLKQTDYDGKSETFHIVSIEQNEVKELQAYPNPVSHTSSLLGVDSDKPLRIFNTVGVEVTGRVNISISPSKKTLVDMSELPNGMYYVVNGNESIRLMKE